MLIRAMDINDLERIVELEHILFTSTWDVSDFMYEILENQFSYNFVLEVDEQIVGYVGVCMSLCVYLCLCVCLCM